MHVGVKASDDTSMAPHASALQNRLRRRQNPHLPLQQRVDAAQLCYGDVLLQLDSCCVQGFIRRQPCLAPQQHSFVRQVLQCC